MNILIVCQYSGSESMGMAYRPYYLAQQFTQIGHTCTIVTSSFSHTRYTQPKTTGLITETQVDGVNFSIIKTHKYKGNGLLRALSFLTFPLLLRVFSRYYIKKYNPDIVILSSPTPLTIHPVLRIAKKSQSKVIFEIRDLWPMTLVELGGYKNSNPFIKLMQYCEDLALTKCDACVSVLPLAKNYLVSRGLAKDKFFYIPNGVVSADIPNIVPTDRTATIIAAIRDLKCANNFIVGYAGAHGFANELDKLIQVAKILVKENVRFVIVGSGPEKNRLREQVEQLGLATSVLFFDPVPKTDIGLVVREFDVGFLGLKHSPLFRFGVSCNKLFDYMAASIPIVQSIDAGNDLVTESNCGISIRDGNPNRIADAIEDIRRISSDGRAILGRNGNNYLVQNHLYTRITSSYQEIFLDLAKAGTRK